MCHQPVSKTHFNWQSVGLLVQLWHCNSGVRQHEYVPRGTYQGVRQHENVPHGTSQVCQAAQDHGWALKKIIWTSAQKRPLDGRQKISFGRASKNVRWKGTKKRLLDGLWKTSLGWVPKMTFGWAPKNIFLTGPNSTILHTQYLPKCCCTFRQEKNLEDWQTGTTTDNVPTTDGRGMVGWQTDGLKLKVTRRGQSINCDLSRLNELYFVGIQTEAHDNNYFMS